MVNRPFFPWSVAGWGGGLMGRSILFRSAWLWKRGQPWSGWSWAFQKPFYLPSPLTSNMWFCETRNGLSLVGGLVPEVRGACHHPTWAL